MLAEPALLGPARAHDDPGAHGQWMPARAARRSADRARTRRCIVSTPDSCGSTSSVFSSMISRLRVAACQARMSMTPRFRRSARRSPPAARPSPAASSRCCGDRPMQLGVRRVQHTVELGSVPPRANVEARMPTPLPRPADRECRAACAPRPPARPPSADELTAHARAARDVDLAEALADTEHSQACCRPERRPSAQRDDKCASSRGLPADC